MPATIAQSVYQLKITLLGARPPIWRRVLVPSTMNLGQLHDVIQNAMGWYDCHLHEFTIDGEPYGPANSDFFDMGDRPPNSERTAKLSNVLGWKGAKARYIYDFGDGWEHDIVVEKVLPDSGALILPVCIDGKRRCPLEDCGGIGGYYSLLENLSNPSSEDHKDLMEWAGGPIDPEDFSIEETNDRLAPLRKRKKPHAKAAASSSSEGKSH